MNSVLETIALPFNVQKISHATRGEIVPFASYNGGSSQKPFWLASISTLIVTIPLNFVLNKFWAFAKKG